MTEAASERQSPIASCPAAKGFYPTTLPTHPIAPVKEILLAASLKIEVHKPAYGHRRNAPISMADVHAVCERLFQATALPAGECFVN